MVKRKHNDGRWNLIKRLSSVLLILTMLTGLLSGCGTPKPPVFEDAKTAVANMNIGWNLGNTLDSTGNWIIKDTDGSVETFETAWGNPVTTRELIAHVKELGFGAVRVPVTWLYHYTPEGVMDEAWIGRVQEIVDYVLAEDMYCIINVHHDTGADGWLRADAFYYERRHEMFEKIWTQVAERFIDYPEKLLFEGFNEMLDANSEWNTPSAESLEIINAYNQDFVNAVRATGGNNASRNLIVNTYAAAHNDKVLGAFVMPEDTTENHLIAEVHDYSPWAFTSTSATWTQMTDKFDEAGKKEVDWDFTLLNKYFVANDIPLIIGEFGSEDKNNTEEREKHFAYVVSSAKQLGITCFIWDNGGEFNMGLVDRNAVKDPFPTIIKAAVDAANGG